MWKAHRSFLSAEPRHKSDRTSTISWTKRRIKRIKLSDVQKLKILCWNWSLLCFINALIYLCCEGYVKGLASKPRAPLWSWTRELNTYREYWLPLAAALILLKVVSVSNNQFHPIYVQIIMYVWMTYTKYEHCIIDQINRGKQMNRLIHWWVSW